MTQVALFELEEETREWVPLFKPFGLTVANLIAEVGCRDCGAKTGFNQGGSTNAGIYSVCDECACVDQCRPSKIVAEAHTSRWGSALHPAEQHDALVAKRDARRARYLKRAAA